MPPDLLSNPWRAEKDGGLKGSPHSETKKRRQRRLSGAGGSGREIFFLFFFSEHPLAPQCLSRMTDAEAQPRTTSGGGLRRVSMLNKHIQSSANPLNPPPHTPTKPHFGYNIDSSDSSVYTSCLYIGINVPSLARRL